MRSKGVVWSKLLLQSCERSLDHKMFAKETVGPQNSATHDSSYSTISWHAIPAMKLHSGPKARSVRQPATLFGPTQASDKSPATALSGLEEIFAG